MKNNIKINLIDVGCSDYMVEPWKNYYDNIKFILGFDVSGTKEYKKELILKRIKHKIVNKVVFNKEESKKLYCCYKSQNSSLFLPNMKIIKKYLCREKNPDTDRLKKRMRHFEVKKIKKVKCVCLDSIIEKLNFDFDFIKIDTQGSELQVLKSLGKYIDTQIIGVFTELFFKELYHGMSIFTDVDNFFKSHNFYKAKMFDNYDRFTSDFLYIREDKDKNKKEKIEFIKKIYKIK